MNISDLHPDKKNANKGTKRGAESVQHSLREYGAGRSILVDRNGSILAGNTTARNAIAAGIDQEVIVVETDGTKLVVVQRTDLDTGDPKAKALAIADNRTAELGLEWDPDVIKGLAYELDLQPFWSPDELSTITGLDEVMTGAPGPETLEGRYKEQYGVIVMCADESMQQKIYEQLTASGLDCRVVVT